MKIDKSKIKRILFISLSNIGDIILTTPVLRVLAENFPKAMLDVMVGPKGVELFRRHPAVFKVINYDKHESVNNKRKLVQKLRRVKYDLIVDMRNSLFPFLVGAKYRTNPVAVPPKTLRHKKRQHLWKLTSIGLNAKDADFYVHIPEEDREYVEKMMAGLDRSKSIVAISPGAMSDVKKWPKNNFSRLASKLIKELDAQVVMVGDALDASLIRDIVDASNEDIIDLSGRTTLCQLASVLKKSDLLITNDSAPLHLAEAVGTRVLAIFGPTDAELYGPTGKDDCVIRQKLNCSPCMRAQCKSSHECMNNIEVDEVFRTAKEMLGKRVESRE